ncbi:MAG: ABC transporter permease [Nitrosopumilus sp.]|nr:ABC transporter permease [Nitrosopumilus sp.]
MSNKNKIINFNLIMCILACIAVIYIIYPLASIFTFAEPENLLDSFTRPKVIDALVISIISASISTILIAIFGIPLAFCLARYRFPGSFLVKVVVIIPLVLPPLASGVLLLGVFSPQSTIDMIFPGIEFTQSLVGIIIAQTYVASPFMILASQAAFESVDESFEKIARVLGKKKIEVFVKISLPLAKKGILIGFIMTWIRAVGELGATIMMAYNPHTISIQIFEDNAIGGLRQAIPSIILVILLSVVIIFLFSIIMKRFDEKTTKDVLNFRRVEVKKEEN